MSKFLPMSFRTTGELVHNSHLVELAVGSNSYLFDIPLDYQMSEFEEQWFKASGGTSDMLHRSDDWERYNKELTGEVIKYITAYADAIDQRPIIASFNGSRFYRQFFNKLLYYAGYKSYGYLVDCWVDISQLELLSRLYQGKPLAGITIPNVLGVGYDAPLSEQNDAILTFLAKSPFTEQFFSVDIPIPIEDVSE